MDGKSKGVPISPFLDISAVVIKDKNEEVRRYPWCPIDLK